MLGTNKSQEYIEAYIPRATMATNYDLHTANVSRKYQWHWNKITYRDNKWPQRRWRPGMHRVRNPDFNSGKLTYQSLETIRLRVSYATLLMETSKKLPDSK